MYAVTRTASITRPDDTTQYAANDVITTATTASTLDFALCNRFTGGGYMIVSAILEDSAAPSTKIDADLWLFSADITDLDADNAPFTPTDAQMETVVGRIAFPVASFVMGATDTNGAIQVLNLNIVASANTLYGVLVARNTYTPVGLEKFTVTLGIVQY